MKNIATGAEAPIVERSDTMTDQFDVKPKPYTDAWWWSQDGGQRIARIMMEMMQHNDNTNAHYSHDFVVMVAKKAVEAGYKTGWGDGHNDGYEDARRRLG